MSGRYRSGSSLRSGPVGVVGAGVGAGVGVGVGPGSGAGVGVGDGVGVGPGLPVLFSNSAA